MLLARALLSLQQSHKILLDHKYKKQNRAVATRFNPCFLIYINFYIIYINRFFRSLFYINTN